jgi:hypothetical protein
MRRLHVHDAFIFFRLELRQMRVYRRRFARVRVHMEERGVKHRQKKRGYRAAGCQSSHGLYSDAAGI